MSESKFPKAQELHKAELEAWTRVFVVLESLDGRLKVVENKLGIIRTIEQDKKIPLSEIF